MLRLDAGTTVEELIGHCAATLAGFKVPKNVVLTASLPKNPSGKVLKRDLRERWVDPAPPDRRLSGPEAPITSSTGLDAGATTGRPRVPHIHTPVHTRGGS